MGIAETILVIQTAVALVALCITLAAYFIIKKREERKDAEVGDIE